MVVKDISVNRGATAVNGVRGTPPRPDAAWMQSQPKKVWAFCLSLFALTPRPGKELHAVLCAGPWQHILKIQ
jgi:hypothetical protein